MKILYQMKDGLSRGGKLFSLFRGKFQKALDTGSGLWYNILVWRRSSAGQSVRFTSERSWVRAPSSPPESTVILIELRWIFYVSVSLSRVFWRCFRKARFAISWIHSSFSCMSNNWSLSMVSGKRRVAVMLRELLFSTANEYSYIRQRRRR